VLENTGQSPGLVYQVQCTVSVIASIHYPAFPYNI